MELSMISLFVNDFKLFWHVNFQSNFKYFTGIFFLPEHLLFSDPSVYKCNICGFRAVKGNTIRQGWKYQADAWIEIGWFAPNTWFFYRMAELRSNSICGSSGESVFPNQLLIKATTPALQWHSHTTLTTAGEKKQGYFPLKTPKNSAIITLAFNRWTQMWLSMNVYLFPRLLHV